MQDADAARRLAILRGETPPPLPEAEQPADPSDKKHTRRDRDGTSGGARKRKRAGEDDTEFEMRVARERAEEGARVAGELAEASGSKRQKQKEREEVNIVDSRGHIDLIGPPPKDAGGGDDRKETTDERTERKGRENGEKYARMHRNGDFSGQPWYEEAQRRRPIVNAWFLDACAAAASLAVADDQEDEREAVRKARRKAERLLEAPTTDVWGRDDPKRRERETARLDANDPLAAMKSGAKKVRDVLRERGKDAEERRRELEQLRQEERRREKRRKREQEDADEDDNEDGPLPESHRSGRSERRHHGEERHENRRVHVHREERRRRREAERARDREHDRHHGKERERSRERGTSSRSHRSKDRDDRHDHRGRDHERREKHHERRDSEAKRTE